MDKIIYQWIQREKKNLQMLISSWVSTTVPEITSIIWYEPNFKSSKGLNAFCTVLQLQRDTKISSIARDHNLTILFVILESPDHILLG